MHASRLSEANGIFHVTANSFAVSSVRAATETISTPSIFASALAWISPIAPVPARQIFIEPPKNGCWSLVGGLWLVVRGHETLARPTPTRRTIDRPSNVPRRESPRPLTTDHRP